MKKNVNTVGIMLISHESQADRKQLDKADYFTSISK